MAEQTQIAQELGRILEAKRALGTKGASMGLVFTDEDGGSRQINAQTNIEMIADAFDDIYEIDPEADLAVVGNTITFPQGYLPNASSKSVNTTDVATPIIEFNSTTGNILAKVEQSAGYVEADVKTSNINVLDFQGTGITPENIRDGCTIFGVEGTYTRDGNVGEAAILEGMIAYSQGVRIVGTMANIGVMGDDGVVEFNPLEEDVHTCVDTPGGYVQKLGVKVSAHLLERLREI